jgi:polyketide synthase 7
MTRGAVRKELCRRVFLYSSQGGQWPGMGAALYAQEPAFKDVIDACDREVASQLGWSLRALLRKPAPEALFDDPSRIQPALTAVQIGLSALLRSRGVEPHAVGGLSMGEVAAAFEAQVLSLPDAMRVVCVQARLTRNEQPDGRMAFAALSREAAQRRLAASSSPLWLAVELTPSMTVISGESRAVQQWVTELQHEGIRAGYVPMKFAFHCPLVDGLEAEFRSQLADLQPRPPRLPLFSAVGPEAWRDSFGVDHWWAIMRESASLPVMLNPVLARGARQIVEIGPEPILQDAIVDIVARAGSNARASGTMRRSAADADALAQVATALGA